MNPLLRPYRPHRMTIEMSEQEVADMVAATKDYYHGDLVGRRPDFCRYFAGKSLTLRFDGDGPCIEYSFTDAHKLTWKEGDIQKEEYYEALQIDKGIYLIAYLQKNSRPATSFSIVLDMDMNLTTMIKSSMGTAFSPRYVNPRVYHGVIEHDGLPTPIAWRHQPTRDLVGASMGWSYRDDMTSQHIFGTPHSIAWVILQGPGSGLLGTAPCKYFKITDDVYLYSWVETQGSGQQGVVLMNQRIMHDVGTFYGIHHGQQFEFYTYGAKGYNLGSYDTKGYFKI